MFFWKFWGIVLQYVLFDIRMDWCGIRWMKEVGGGSMVKILMTKWAEPVSAQKILKEQKKLKKLYF